MNAPKHGHVALAAAGAVSLVTLGMFGVAPTGCTADTVDNADIAELAHVDDTAVSEVVAGESAALATCSLGFNFRYEHFGLSFVSDAFASNVSTQLDSGGGIMTVDTVVNAESGHREMLLTHVDGVGPAVWTRRYWLPDLDLYGNSLVQAHDKEHVIVTGRVGDDILIMKIEIFTGNVVWSSFYFESMDQGSDFTFGKGLIAERYTDAAGVADYLVAGTAWREEDPTNQHTVLLRIDDSGGLGWGHRYESTGGEGRTDVPVALQPKDGLDDPFWVGLNHEFDESSAFALMDVNPADGSPGLVTFYPQPEQGAQVELGDLIARADEDFVATYTVYSPGFGLPSPRVALLPINPDRTPGVQTLYWSPTQVNDTADYGLAIEESGEGFDIGTYTFVFEDEAGGAAFVPALLSVDFNGTPFSYRHYKDYDFSGLGLAPMAPVAEGYVLKTYDAQFLHLTRTAGLDGCCARDIDFVREEVEVGYEEEERLRWTWEMDGLDVLSEPVERSEEICRE